MNLFTVSLFGHRTIDDLRQLDNQLTPIIRELLCKPIYIAFLIGRNGEFDEYAASVIKRTQKELNRDNSDITLVLPYAVANTDDYEAYYHGIIIPEHLHGIHPKSAITARNRWMIERSDLVIAYVAHNQGGAYTAMKYAAKLNKNIINLCESSKPPIPISFI